MPFFLLLAGGTAILVLAAVGIVPSAILARVGSGDGVLSEALTGRLTSGQFSMGWTLLAAALLAALPQRRIRSVILGIRQLPLTAVIACAALLSAVITAWTQWHLFDNMPHVTDAFSHIFQARLFAEGRLWAPVPPCPEHFFQYNTLMTGDGRWFTSYPPGHALLLAAFVRCGVLPAYGPLLTALTVGLFGWIVARTMSRGAAAMAVTLAALSPLHALVGASFMSHVTAVFTLVAAVACAVAACHRARMGRHAATWWTLCGLFAGWTIVTRPQDAILLVPPALWIFLTAPAETRRILLRGALWVALGLLPAAILQLGWNHLMYGRALTLGYGRLDTGAFTPLLVPAFGFHEGFSPIDALRQFAWNLQRFDQALLGWPAVSAIALLGLTPRRTRREAIGCAIALVATFALYFAYDYYGREYEARFFYPVAMPCIALAALGLLDLRTRMARTFGTPGRNLWALAVVALCAHGPAHYWPRYLAPEYGKHYEEVTPEPAELAKAGHLRHALILMPSDDDHAFLFSSGFWHNDADLTNSVLFARDRSADHGTCLRRVFADRTWYRYVPGAPGQRGRIEAITEARPP